MSDSETPWTAAHQVPLSVGKKVRCNINAPSLQPLMNINESYSQQPVPFLSQLVSGFSAKKIILVLKPPNTVCMNVKSLQLHPTLCNPVDCSPPGSSVHGILQEEQWSGLAFPFPGIFLTQGSNPGLLHWRVGSLPLSHQGSPLD